MVWEWSASATIRTSFGDPSWAAARCSSGLNSGFVGAATRTWASTPPCWCRTPAPGGPGAVEPPGTPGNLAVDGYDQPPPPSGRPRPAAPLRSHRASTADSTSAPTQINSFYTSPRDATQGVAIAGSARSFRRVRQAIVCSSVLLLKVGQEQLPVGQAKTLTTGGTALRQIRSCQ